MTRRTHPPLRDALLRRNDHSKTSCTSASSHGTKFRSISPFGISRLSTTRSTRSSNARASGAGAKAGARSRRAQISHKVIGMFVLEKPTVIGADGQDYAIPASRHAIVGEISIVDGELRRAGGGLPGARRHEIYRFVDRAARSRPGPPQEQGRGPRGPPTLDARGKFRASQARQNRGCQQRNWSDTARRRASDTIRPSRLQVLAEDATLARGIEFDVES